FLLFCALQNSPTFGEDGYCGESAANFNTVVKQGRKPGLELMHGGIPVSMSSWAEHLFEGIRACASLLAKQLQDPAYEEAVSDQYAKVLDVSLTPSARLLETLKQTGSSFKAYALESSQTHTQHFKHAGLSQAERQQAQHMREQSLAEQACMEADKSISFDDYVQQFEASLKSALDS